MDLTGMLLQISGRVVALETSTTDNNQQLLLRPSNSEFSRFQMTWNRQFSDLTTLANDLNAKVKTLQQLYVGLNQLVNQHFSLFTGHTGVPAATGHNGLT
jgi:hypothetical protein